MLGDEARWSSEAAGRNADANRYVFGQGQEKKAGKMYVCVADIHIYVYADINLHGESPGMRGVGSGIDLVPEKCMSSPGAQQDSHQLVPQQYQEISPAIPIP